MDKVSAITLINMTQTNTDHVDNPSSVAPSFGSSGYRSGSNFPKLPVIAAIAVLLLIIAGGFLLVKSKSTSKEEEAPAPTQIIFDENPSPTPSAEPESQEKVDKKELKVNILNGTGIAKEAAFLQKILQDMGFEDIDTGNADKDIYEATSVKFSQKIPSSLKKEILDKLGDNYKKVDESDKAASGSYDIEVITGLRPGVSKPTPKATVKATPATDEEEASPTPTPSISPSPTSST